MFSAENYYLGIASIPKFGYKVAVQSNFLRINRSEHNTKNSTHKFEITLIKEFDVLGDKKVFNISVNIKLDSLVPLSAKGNIKVERETI